VTSGSASKRSFAPTPIAAIAAITVTAITPTRCSTARRATRAIGSD
jgi:hypothetical protein